MVSGPRPCLERNSSPGSREEGRETRKVLSPCGRSAGVRGAMSGMRPDDGRGAEFAAANRRGRFKPAKSRQGLRQVQDTAEQAGSFVVVIDIGREGRVNRQAIVAKSRRS